MAAKKDAEIQQLKSQLEAAEVARRLAVTEAVTWVVARERDELKNDLSLVVVKSSWKKTPSRSSTPCNCVTARARLCASGHEGAPIDQDGGRDAGAALRDGVQPHPRHGVPACAL